MVTVPVIPFACANCAPGTAAICKERGKFACGNCNLVLYCGKKCQTAHWSVHKTACRSPAGRSSWRPAWDRECRDPAWASSAAWTKIHNPYGGHVFLWGNVPAVDVLRLSENEGATYDEDIELLFAASGDLRNVVKTIADLPATASQHIHITINDREFAVVARNTILLLFTLDTLSMATSDDEKARFDIAEALIHLWYSAFVPAKVFSMVRNIVKPLISDVCTKIANKALPACLGKTWTLSSGRSLRLVLPKDQWLRLDRLLCAHDLTLQRAKDMRHAVVLVPERLDFRDRWDFKESTPLARIAKGQFRVDGLLLPFGHPRVEFDTPNILLFQNSDTWLMDDQCDPLNGWPIWEVLRYPSPAKEDRYGKLYAYLRDIFKRFLDRLAAVDIRFEMYCLDARELKNYLGRDKFTRIEASNISDEAYLRVGETLACLSPLLQPPQRNPNATLITQFLNAVIEIAKRTGADQDATLTDAMNYLPTPELTSLLKPQGAEMYRIWDARNLFLDADALFQLYRQHRDFDRLSINFGVFEKETNTIVEKWPTRLKLQQGQGGAREEFNVLLGSNFSAMERYVEWKRTGLNTRV